MNDPHSKKAAQEGTTAETILSVVVPCYNTERYLPDCLRSLLAQDVAGMEVICVNDGSTDGSLGILRAFEAAHPGTIRVLDLPNAGQWYARWAGVDAAHGHYVGFLDSDDKVTPAYAQALLTAARREDADIVIGGFSRIDADTGRALSHELVQPRASFRVADDPGRIVTINGAMWNKIYRRELLQRTRRLETVPLVFEDLTFELLALLATRGRVAYAPVPVVDYNVHAGSAVTSAHLGQVESLKESLLEIRRDYELDGVSPELLAALDASVFLNLGISLPYRLAGAPDVHLGAVVADITAYMDAHFPTWRRSPYITAAYARSHGADYQRLLVAQRLYRAGLIRPLLWAYRRYIEVFAREVKW